MTTATANPAPAQPTEYLDAVGRVYPKRDQDRMRQKPFETTIPALHQQTRDMLRGYKPPLGRAYILFERWNIQIVGEAERLLTYSLWPFSVDDRPEQFTKIEHFVRKGYRILHWGNFYYLTDPKKERMAKAQAHNNAWAELEINLKALAENPGIITENLTLKTENEALLEKLREAEERLVALSAAEADPAPKAAKKSEGK
jgi:hypothetical protein